MKLKSILQSYKDNSKYIKTCQKCKKEFDDCREEDTLCPKCKKELSNLKA